MTEQLKTQPSNFMVEKHFGPFFGSTILADEATNALLKMTDKIIDSKNSKYKI